MANIRSKIRRLIYIIFTTDPTYIPDGNFYIDGAIVGLWTRRIVLGGVAIAILYFVSVPILRSLNKSIEVTASVPTVGQPEQDAILPASDEPEIATIDRDLSASTATDDTAASARPGTLYRVTSIVDGDTIKVSMDDKIETVRFIGIDTPETKDPRKPVQCFGPEASSRMQHYAQSKYVKLVSDPSQDDRDLYGRLLRYVFTEDDHHIGYEMIREGYAREYTYSLPYKYQQEFREAEQYAKDNQLGVWSTIACSSAQ